MAADRLGRAADHRRGPEPRHHLHGRHAHDRDGAARVRSAARPCTVGHELGRLPALQPPDRAARHAKARCGCPIPTRSAAPSRSAAAGGDWQEMPTDGALHGAINWPYAAPDRANYRMLGVADLARAIASGADAARLWRAGAARAGDHGGDPGGRCASGQAVTVPRAMERAAAADRRRKRRRCRPRSRQQSGR